MSNKPATADRQAAEKYGALKEGVHIAGYTLERAVGTLDSLIQGDDWQSVGDGFADINKFLDSIRLDSFRTTVEQRARIAKRIKELQPKVSNRAIGKVLGVAHTTISRGASAPRGGKKVKEKQDGSGASAPRDVSGAQAAKIVQRRTPDVARTQERRAERERELGGRIAAFPSAKFGVILADPEWHDECYSEENGMNE